MKTAKFDFKTMHIIFYDVLQLECTKDEEHRDGRYHELNREWEGTVHFAIVDNENNEKIFKQKFTFSHFASTENGGSGVDKLERPKGLKNKHWEKIQETICEHIENNFTENNQWEPEY